MKVAYDLYGNSVTTFLLYYGYDLYIGDYMKNTFH